MKSWHIEKISGGGILPPQETYGSTPNVLVYNTTYFEGMGKQREKHDCFNLHAVSFSSGRDVFFFIISFGFIFFVVVVLLSSSPSVKI